MLDAGTLWSLGIGLSFVVLLSALSGVAIDVWFDYRDRQVYEKKKLKQRKS